MSILEEQVHYLRSLAADQTPEALYEVFDALNEAADTIESLSAKLQVADIGWSDNSEVVKLIGAMAEELDSCYGRTTELTDKAYEYINRSAEGCGGWIPCEERLPEETGFYMVTKKIKETGERFSGKGHFDIKKGWNDPLNFVDIVAWQPLPEPYQPKGE